MLVDLHVHLIRFYKVFALKSNPVTDWEPLVISMSLLVFYGSKLDENTGSNQAGNPLIALSDFLGLPLPTHCSYSLFL